MGPPSRDATATLSLRHCREAVHCVYSSIIIGKLLYAVSSWWGFASAADRQRLQALLQRGICSGLCSPETPNLTELAESVDDTLFQRIWTTDLYHEMYHLPTERRELVQGGPAKVRPTYIFCW